MNICIKESPICVLMVYLQGKCLIGLIRTDRPRPTTDYVYSSRTHAWDPHVAEHGSPDGWTTYHRKGVSGVQRLYCTVPTLRG